MKAEDWATNLDKALNSFVIEQKTTQWPKSDIVKIKEVVQELGLTGARFAFNSSHVYDIDEERPFFRDQGVLHVHPTMLVATRSFSGSIDRTRCTDTSIHCRITETDPQVQLQINLQMRCCVRN